MILQNQKGDTKMKKYIDELPNEGVARKPIDKELCDGCGKAFEGSVCKAYIDPSVWVKRGGCALKTNKIIDYVKPTYSVKRKFKRAKI